MKKENDLEERAFYIPFKICKCISKLYSQNKNLIIRSIAQEALDNFSKKVGMSYNKLVNIKKILVSCYLIDQNYSKIIEIYNTINTEDLSDDDKQLIQKALRATSGSTSIPRGQNYSYRESIESVLSSVEEAILKSYQEIFIKKNGKFKADIIEIIVKEIRFNKEQLEKYVKDCLGLKANSIEYDAENEEYIISLDKKALEILNSKLDKYKGASFSKSN